ncbi:hypothetical protein TNCV_1634961 [Trichonephila clavipes]|nr:hypothetical protein TNCV_1634961 [Trichonephila clavipes]
MTHEYCDCCKVPVGMFINHLDEYDKIRHYKGFGPHWRWMKDPRVTRVDEWTTAEIGVGAAIAAGSQAEKGNCALLEQAANERKIKSINGN